MRRLTLDSSVIISSLLKKELRHLEALQIWETILSGENRVILPYSVLVEVTAAVRRRTGSEELAVQIQEELSNLASVSFVILDEKSAGEAAKIAAKTAIRGMDALVVQVAREYNTELVTFDEEILLKIKNL